MYKNQLQELAQRSCFNLPAYTCLREGPDHAPRFKAAVIFNGEQFESPGFFTTLRQAEHAAAEVALAALARRGPSYSLAARILVRPPSPLIWLPMAHPPPPRAQGLYVAPGCAPSVPSLRPTAPRRAPVARPSPAPVTH